MSFILFEWESDLICEERLKKNELFLQISGLFRKYLSYTYITNRTLNVSLKTSFCGKSRRNTKMIVHDVSHKLCKFLIIFSTTPSQVCSTCKRTPPTQEEASAV